MNPKQQAIQEIEKLILDMYQDEFSWMGKIVKKFVKPERITVYAGRIMDIFEKYIDTRLKLHTLPLKPEFPQNRIVKQKNSLYKRY